MTATSEAVTLQLATLLGWTNLFAAGGAWLGTPPATEPACRGQAAVPNWCESWEACGPLLAEHRCAPYLGLIDVGKVFFGPTYQGGAYLAVDDFPNVDCAVRTAIVCAAIQRLGHHPRLAGKAAA